MFPRSKLNIAVVFALTSVALLGCSSGETKQPGLTDIAIGFAKAKFSKKDVETVDAEKAAPKIPRDELAKYGKPIMYASVPRLGSGVVAIEVARNGNNHTYLAGDKSSFTINGAVLTATRGLPVDLIAQSVSLSPRKIFNASEYPVIYTRKQRHLNGEGKLTTQEFNCAIVPNASDTKLELFDVSYTVREFTELCKNDKRAFKNSYWIDRPNRRMIQTHQSVSQEVGHAILQVIIP